MRLTSAPHLCASPPSASSAHRAPAVARFKGWGGADEQARRPTEIDYQDHATITLKRAMTIELKPEQENRVAEALRSGAYSSPNDVIDRALEVLHELDEWIAANRQAIDLKIRTGIAELERGEGIPEDELDACLERLKAKPE